MSFGKLWIDADACPKVVKDVVYNVAFKRQVSVTLVANSFIQIPSSPLINFIQVEKGADVADLYIVDNSEKNDLVITADIPLAKLLVDKGVSAINPRGEIYTEENISERLSMRDFMTELRDSGVATKGPAPLGPKDKAAFTNSLDRIMTKMLK